MDEVFEFIISTNILALSRGRWIASVAVSLYCWLVLLVVGCLLVEVGSGCTVLLLCMWMRLEPAGCWIRASHQCQFHVNRVTSPHVKRLKFSNY